MDTKISPAPGALEVFDAQSTRPVEKRTPYQQFGCEVNTISVDGLFARYNEVGFLYAEKLSRLEPYLDEIKENWRRALQAGDRLHKIVTYNDPTSGAWASISTWRSTHGGWSTQHLVSAGDPLASRAVMLAEQEAEIQNEDHRSNQNWFRPNNRMPKRIFGSIVNSLGAENASVDCYNYLEVTPLKLSTCPEEIQVVEVDAWSQAELYDLAVETRGQVYADAEELDGTDFNLSKVDAEYQEVGLRRYRRAWLALDRESGRRLGAIIAYRGPLGFNFSFLESRADLLVSADVQDDRLADVVNQLISAATETYEDFSPGFIPVVADDRVAQVLKLRGDRLVRQYCQSI
jgi:hypothetical protein